jgi:hypothetical protein
MKRAAMSMLLAGLAGCGSGGGEVSQNSSAFQLSNPYADQLRALTPQNRDLALRRAIIDSGERCKRIESSEETGQYKNMATWTARCQGGRDWAVFIAPNGDAQVRSCTHVAQLGLPACKTAAQSGSGSSSSKE